MDKTKTKTQTRQHKTRRRDKGKRKTRHRQGKIKPYYPDPLCWRNFSLFQRHSPPPPPQVARKRIITMRNGSITGLTTTLSFCPVCLCLCLVPGRPISLHVSSSMWYLLYETDERNNCDIYSTKPMTGTNGTIRRENVISDRFQW